MKIELELPDWIEERNIYIFAGVEEVARKIPDKNWIVKEERCNFCGKCCMDVSPNWRFGRNAETGACQFLALYGAKYECKLGIGRPFACCKTDSSDQEHCSITWKEVD